MGKTLRKILTVILAVTVAATLLAGCSVVDDVGTKSAENSVAGTIKDLASGTESAENSESDSETERESASATETKSEDDAGSGAETSGEASTVDSEQEHETETEKQPEPVPPEEPVLPYYIKVDRWGNCVTVYGRDANGDYTVPVKVMVCSVGTGSRTPLGVFTISDQYRWHALFRGTYGQYCSRITGHILFHSVPYSAPASDMLITDAYNQLGTKASLGCIRLKCIDAKWIYENCAPGTTVEIYVGSSSRPEGKPSALKIDPDSPYKGWDPTDPDPANPWKTVPITIEGVIDLRVECGSEVDLLSHVFAWDIDGNTPIDVTIQGTVDTAVCGTYTITYSAVGTIGTTASVSTTVEVVPVPETEPETEAEEETAEDVSETEVPETEVPGTETVSETETETEPETETTASSSGGV